MPERADTLDLSHLRLEPGAGRRIDDLEVGLEGLELGAQHYDPTATVPVVLDLSRMAGGGYSMRLRFTAPLSGPCMRCLAPATHEVNVDAREVHDPHAQDPDLQSPYLSGEELDLRAWARDSMVLALPNRILCRPDCAGLCPECGADLNTAGPEHVHEREPDPRWAALREIKLDQPGS